MLFYATRKYSKVALGGDFQTARQVYPKALMTQNQEPWQGRVARKSALFC